MRIKWHGHSCFEISGNAAVLTDPHDGASIGLAPPKASPDVVTVSHEHYDHNAVGAVDGTPEIVRGAGMRSVRGVDILGVETCHDEQGGAKRGKNTVFAVTMSGMRVVHLGDLGHPPTEAQAREIGWPDVLLVPVGGVYTVDAAGALETVARLRPKVAVPMHYRVGGLKLGIAPLSEFTKKLTKVTPLRDVGNEVELEADDLPEKMEVWTFRL
jgi:L-ascorbate metabolism protein UlaG (beta-lactamase superfamily)